MDTTATPQPATEKTKGLIGTVKYVFTISTILGLLSTNIATLTSDAAHTSLFDGLKQAIGYALADTVADALLSHSPSSVRKTDVTRKSTQQTAEIQQLRNTLSAVETSNKKLVEDKADITKRFQKLSTDNDELKTSHQKLRTDHDELNTRHAKLNNDHQHLVNANRLRQDKVRAISSRMAPRIGGIATKSLASLPGRAAPYLGTAVSVGFTAWELTELCSLMNDLDELNIAFGQMFNDPNKVCGLPRPSISDFHF